MKAEELRIGNWVFNKAHERKQLKEVYADCSVYDAIELTEEWLIKFGFEIDNNLRESETDMPNWSVKAEDGFGVRYLGGMGKWLVNLYNWDRQHQLTLYGNVKYIHQLQNLYFSLTGEELEIK